MTQQHLFCYDGLFNKGKLGALEKAIKSAKKEKEAVYTTATWKVFTEALSHAESVLKEGKAAEKGTKELQDKIDQATKDLVTAQKALVKKPVTNGNTDGSTSGNGKTTKPKGNLPQTGEAKNQGIVIGFVLLGATAASAYYIHRRKDEDAA